MGTNYYAIEKHCPNCNRRDLVHIGKKSVGWQFFFRGYPDTRTVEQWRMRLADASGIEDEYGRPIAVDDFWKMVEASKGLKDHITHCLESGYSESTRLALARGDEWHDAGFSFSIGEFS